VIEAVQYGGLTAALFTLWPLAQAENIRAAALFRDAAENAYTRPRLPYVVAILVLVAALLASASWFTGSTQLTLWTSGGVIGALILLALTATGIRWLARVLRRRSYNYARTRWAISAISGKNEGAAAIILAIGLGLSVLAAMGQIDGNLRQAIKNDLPEVAPSYFFVDIQKSQMSEFRQMMADTPQVSRYDAAPMLRAVVTQINGKPALEVAPDHWVVRGDRGITYAEKLPDRYAITAGEWWPENYEGPPQISFAKEEAEEIGLVLGDTVTVNILGRDITGTITSFRDVDFSTAGIGFVMTMNPAALQGAPHTFIATVYADAEYEAQLLRDLAEPFPNITAIRIKDAIERVSSVLNSIAAAVSYGAAATLLTGFLVLIGSAISAQHARNFESAILKTLGASRRDILFSFALRSGVMGATAGFVAIFVGIAAGWAINYFIMDADFAVIWSNAIGVVTGGILANVLANLVFAMRALNASPARILRSRE